MKPIRGIPIAAILITLVASISARAQQPAQQSSAVREALQKIVSQEQDLAKTFGNYSPRVETYIQENHRDKEGAVRIVGDDYFLGRLVVKNGVVEQSFLPSSSHFTLHSLMRKVLLYGPILDLLSFRLKPGTFAYPILIDPQKFDLAHYDFEFASREFLGQVRCLVFNVKPRAQAGKGLFEGRIWVEDKGYHIVRINGTRGRHSDFTFHFDSWRENLQPGLWLPVYVYSEETDLANYGVAHRGFRSQTRLWGYVLKATTPDQELTQILVDSKSPVKDASAESHDNSPLESERDWRHEAEQNVLNRLQKGGLMAPPSPVDKVLETVVNNLIVTNKLDNLPAIHCRVLMTYPLETFTVGDTIVVSRGLVDVLPDEASLAMVLAHELAHIKLGDQINTNYSFYDRMVIPDEQLLKTFDFARSEQQEQAADQEAIVMLQNSPYKDQMGKAGLFLKALAAIAPDTPNLFGAHLGNRMINEHQQLRMAQLMQGAPQLEPKSIDQIAALPLGARIKVDSWDDEIRLMKSASVALISAKDKMPFEVTPLIPYLTPYSGKAGP